MALKDDLIKSIPLFQQNSLALRQYIETSGEVFDEVTDAIDNFKTYSDYQHISEDQLGNLSALFDLKVFSNLDEFGRRKFAKDATKLYKKLGTKQALTYIFNVIGINVEIEEMWMLAPTTINDDIRWLYNGSIKYTESDIGQYYNSTGTISAIVPLDFIRGSAVVYPNGTYVDLYNGSDVFSQWPIYGEEYDEYADLSKFYMIKVPYYDLNITHESYNLYVDADGPLDYVNAEKIALAQEMLTQTLYEYIGANEVIVSIRLAEISTENLEEVIDVRDDDFSINLDLKASLDQRVYSFTIPSEETFGGNIDLNQRTTVFTINSEETFGVAVIEHV